MLNIKMNFKLEKVCALVLMLFLIGCTNNIENKIFVQDSDQLKAAIENAVAGDIITLKNGVWKDVEIKFVADGEKGNPIVLKAETPGKVFIEGVSNLKFGGNYLVVDGFYFRNGFTPSNAVIDFKISKDKVANNCTVRNTVIEDFNQLSRDRKDHWVEFWGRHNVLERSYLSGKSNEGPTVRVEIKGNRNIKNYHKIINNHFGPRPRKGGPKAETIQLGDSFSSMSPSNTLVANNLFEECNGEVEIISSKTNYNEFRNNVFYKSEGSLVTRHGNYCIIDGNYFIGDGNSKNYGGIRLINTGHSVTNNYFYNLKGESFRSPLAVMNGIPKSPLNRYNQVTDVVVAYNTWINSSIPLQFGVGENLEQAEVLPASELRSARPLRMLVANNLLYTDNPSEPVIMEHDKADGVRFENNYINNYSDSLKQYDGLISASFQLEEIGENLLAPVGLSDEIAFFDGFEFDKISKDIFGNSRVANNSVGAIISSANDIPDLLNNDLYGPIWFSIEKNNSDAKEFILNASGYNLSQTLKEVGNGDQIILNEGVYSIDASLKISKRISIIGKGEVKIQFTGNDHTPLFEMNPKGDLTLENVELIGNGSNYAFASLSKNMSSHYNLKVTNSSIINFDFVLKAYKQSFAQEITFENSHILNCKNGLELSEEINDKGDYNVEFLTIDSCQFENVGENVIDYYRGGYDESTIGGNLLVSNSSFTNCGAKEKNNILLNTRGIVNVDISNNTFKNNKIRLVALLWGAKNNKHSNNTVVNSGSIVTEQNLKLKLVY